MKNDQTRLHNLKSKLRRPLRNPITAIAREKSDKVSEVLSSLYFYICFCIPSSKTCWDVRWSQGDKQATIMAIYLSILFSDIDTHGLLTTQLPPCHFLSTFFSRGLAGLQMGLHRKAIKSRIFFESHAAATNQSPF